MKHTTFPTVLISALVFLAGAGVAVAQTGPATGGGTLPPVSLCPKLVVVGPAETSLDTALRARSSFSAAKTTDLVFHVLFDPSLGDDHVVTLKVFTPHGYLYRTLDVPIAPEKGEAPLGSRRLAGYPYPVKVQAPRSVTVDRNRYASVDVSFPVAGSSIVTSSLYGQWRVEIYMDGAAKPCSARTVFYIRP